MAAFFTSAAPNSAEHRDRDRRDAGSGGGGQPEITGDGRTDTQGAVRAWLNGLDLATATAVAMRETP